MPEVFIPEKIIERVEAAKANGKYYGINFFIRFKGKILEVSQEFTARIDEAAANLGRSQTPEVNTPHGSILHLHLKSIDVPAACKIFSTVVRDVIQEELILQFSKHYVTSTGEVGTGHTWFDWKFRELKDGVQDESPDRKLQQIQKQLHEKLRENGIKHEEPIKRCSDVATSDEQRAVLDRDGVNNVGKLNEHITKAYFRGQLPQETIEQIQETQPALWEMMACLANGDFEFCVGILTEDGKVPVGNVLYTVPLGESAAAEAA